MKNKTATIALCYLLVLTMFLCGCKSSDSHSSLPSDNNNVLDSVLTEFYKISSIPRGSLNETGIRNHLVSWATEHGLVSEVKAAGNLIVRVPASKGMEKHPTIVLQTHMDMVCVKEDHVDHDFNVDPIIPIREGDWLRAKGTSLGADDGIGMALVLALVKDPSFKHPSLELLFTVDEEGSFTGAKNLESDVLKGKYLLNIDNEDEGLAFIGSAGSAYRTMTLGLEFEKVPAGYENLEIAIKGGLGGHSGVEIDLGRANAIKLMGRILKAISEKTDIRISNLSGGFANNSIPAECSAKIFVKSSERDSISSLIASFSATIGHEFAQGDPNIKASLAVIDGLGNQAFTSDTSNKVIGFINDLPNGVKKYDEYKAVVISNNIGVVKTEGQQLSVISLQRSNLLNGLDEISSVIDTVVKTYGADVQEVPVATPWEPKYDSILVLQAKKIYEKLFAKQLEVTPVHAGLECGAIALKYPNMLAISIGPTVEEPHSVMEKVYIPSIEPVYVLMKELCSQLE